MQNTLQLDDRLLVNMLYYRFREPVFQEVMIFRAPPSAGLPPDSDFIKRCMGVPGDVVQMRGRLFLRNARKVAEPYVKWGALSEGLSYGYDMKIVDGKVYSRDLAAPGVAGLWTGENDASISDQTRIQQAAPGPVPAGHYLMLGDYRNNSNDSHLWGLVPRADLVGRPMLIYWPSERMRNLN